MLYSLQIFTIVMSNKYLKTILVWLHCWTHPTPLICIPSRHCNQGMRTQIQSGSDSANVGILRPFTSHQSGPDNVSRSRYPAGPGQHSPPSWYHTKIDEIPSIFVGGISHLSRWTLFAIWSFCGSLLLLSEVPQWDLQFNGEKKMWNSIHTRMNKIFFCWK